ncbi:MAG TPA: sugar dehydrogenase [Noviherbaspirillum sp.]|uniref:PQQ-dependent sugar dehydrogenase n=1 Tax=Noviherbaspirillum sp. TaxID=1926288 RepID=UPI002F95A75F
MTSNTMARPTPARWLGMLLCAAFLNGCGGGGGGGDSTADSAADSGATARQATAASVSQPLESPETLRGGLINNERNLTVPPGFGIRVWARLDKPRFMALAPNGDVLVSVPSEGRIALLRERPNDTPEEFTFAGGLNQPHDMVFHTIGNTTWLYVAESNRITRSVYRSGETATAERQTVVGDLPDASLSELRGTYEHALKNIALSPDDKLYVSIASACNACAEDTTADPVRGAIYQYSADGKDGRLFARGIRNAEGLDFLPGTSTLWVAVNNRDQLRVPTDTDIDGDGESDRGKQLPQYIDENPIEPFTSVRDGGNYGWPFCNAQPNPTMSNLDSVFDLDLNPDNSVLDCAAIDRPAKGMRAHSAPLGFSFLHRSGVPEAYRRGAAVAQHGCWNCSSLRAGYKVTYFPFDASGNAGAEIDLVTGFVTDPDARSAWGRPVDVIADARGNLLISDDLAGAIYQLYPK